jgi:hypothetical protein
VWEWGKTKASTPVKRRMKAHSAIPARQAQGLASSFSLTEKLARGASREPDERIQGGILTMGLALLPPSRSMASAGPVAAGANLFALWSSYPNTVAQPSRNLTGFPIAWLLRPAEAGLFQRAVVSYAAGQMLPRKIGDDYLTND